MLRFSEPLTPAAAEILRCCLETSADLARDDALGDEWPLTYPLAARCFTAKLARDTLLDPHSTELSGDVPILSQSD
jgi:hypothetical protein